MMIDRRTMLAGAAALAFAAPAAGQVPPADRDLRVPVTGGSLYVRVNGNLAGPKPPLMLVHGGPGGALWQFFPTLPLAADRAIILYDQLDSGRSDAPGTLPTGRLTGSSRKSARSARHSVSSGCTCSATAGVASSPIAMRQRARPACKA